MNAPKLVIIADDLTGAADSAARCVNAGLSAEIWLEATPQPTTVDVIAISTDSRFLPPDEARQRVAATVAAFGAWTGATWYKKIDSTLRGNLGPELDAMLAALPDHAAVICPAFPAQKRGLEWGKLVYANTEARHLPTLLTEQSATPVGVVDLWTVREGVTELEAELRARREAGNRLLVVDAMTEGDLDIIVTATSTENYLLCGSAGMVAAFAARLAEREAREGTLTSVARGPILAVVGSGSEIAHTQVAQVAAAGSMRVRALDNNWYEMDLVGAEAAPVGDWLLHLAPPASGVAVEGAAARAQAARLADVAFAATEKLQPSTLVIVGGDTAYYVLRQLGINRLAVVEELLPGIALTFGTDRAGVQRAVILKPGNFGDEAVLLTLQQAVRARQQPETRA